MDFENMKYVTGDGCSRGLCRRGCGRQDRQLNTYDWLADVQEMQKVLISWKFSLRIQGRVTTIM